MDDNPNTPKNHLPAGMYMLHVQSEKYPEQTRVIKVVVR